MRRRRAVDQHLPGTTPDALDAAPLLGDDVERAPVVAAEHAREAAAVGIPDAVYGQEIMACVVLKPGSACETDDLLHFAERELGRYKRPKIIRIVDALPKGPSGKVQRLKLLETLA